MIWVNIVCIGLVVAVPVLLSFWMGRLYERLKWLCRGLDNDG